MDTVVAHGSTAAKQPIPISKNWSDQGIKPLKDPIIERDREKAANSPVDVPTFSGCREAYIKAHAPAWSNPKRAQQWTNSLKTYAEPVIGKLPVNLDDDDHYLKVNEANPKRLSAEQVRLIRSLAAEGISVEEIITEVGALNETQVKNVVAGRTYQRVH